MKQPLFGQDSSPHLTSLILSSIITLICWIIFCVLCFVIKFKPSIPQYKEVQIVLSQDYTPVKEETPEVPEPVEGPETAASEAFENVEVIEEQPVAAVETPEIPKPVENPVAEAKQEAPKQDATSAPAKTEPAKTNTKATTPAVTPKATDPAKKVNFDDYQYAADYSDFDFNNTSSSNTKNNSFDWSQFDDSSTETQPAVSQKVDKVTTQSTLSGSAAETSTEKNQRQTSTSSTSKTSQDSVQTASSSTSAAAEAIKNTSASTSTAGNTSGSSNQQKFSSDLDINWSGGTVRKQIGSLSIDLKDSGSYVTEKKTTVKIEFTVDEKGYVMAGSVKITPESLLHELVRKEVVSEINKWRFMESTSRSIATFEYTIEKR